jgi:hypothetical protein
VGPVVDLFHRDRQSELLVGLGIVGDACGVDFDVREVFLGEAAAGNFNFVVVPIGAYERTS